MDRRRQSDKLDQMASNVAGLGGQRAVNIIRSGHQLKKSLGHKDMLKRSYYTESGQKLDLNVKDDD